MHEASALGGPDNPHPPSGLPIVEAIGVSKRDGATVA